VKFYKVLNEDMTSPIMKMDYSNWLDGRPIELPEGLAKIDKFGIHLYRHISSIASLTYPSLFGKRIFEVELPYMIEKDLTRNRQITIYKAMISNYKKLSPYDWYDIVGYLNIDFNCSDSICLVNSKNYCNGYGHIDSIIGREMDLDEMIQLNNLDQKWIVQYCQYVEDIPEMRLKLYDGECIAYYLANIKNDLELLSRLRSISKG